jgi:hypothetical protein
MLYFRDFPSFFALIVILGCLYFSPYNQTADIKEKPLKAGVIFSMQSAAFMVQENITD